MIEAKIKSIKEKFNLNGKNKYIEEALFVAVYEDVSQTDFPHNFQTKETEKPNRILALIGDRFLKLVLTVEEKKKTDNIDELNKFVNDHESDKYLAGLNIVNQFDGYAKENGVVVENKKRDTKVIATMIEAIIGALYLNEIENKGTNAEAWDFILKFLIKK